MSYEAIPYHSTPFPATHPEHLAAIARLFAIDAPDPRHCRVLELGAASGGNLIPLGHYLPQSRLLGIDLSPGQVAAGQRLLQQSGIGNVELQVADVLDFDPGAERFDYIIAHGLYSWVPAPVREALLALMGRALSDRGIAYISYNTLPGWQMRGMLREMVLDTVRGEPQPERRLALARRFLDQLYPALGAGLHADYLREEIRRIRAHHPSYLFHEYLAPTNEPVLFRQFVAAAARHGLAYLADSELHTMFPETLEEGAAPLLKEATDAIDLAQRMDFLVNRNFRQSLLCRSGLAREGEAQPDRLMDLALHTTLLPPKKIDLHKLKAAPFTAANGQRHDIYHPLTKVALSLLYERYPQAMAVAELQQLAAEQVASAGEPFLAGQTEHLEAELFGLLAHGLVGAAPQTETAPLPSLCAHRLARAQAAAGSDHTVGRHHTTVQLDPFARALLGLLDGTRDRAALVDAMVQRIAADAELRRLVGEAVEGERLRRMVVANVERLLTTFARHGLLGGVGTG